MNRLKGLLFPALALILSGCMGYQVGSTLDPKIRTVSLSVVNQTDEPSIEVAVMKALRAELQLDGRLEVRSEAEADAALCVTLNRFELQALAFSRVQGSLAEEYRITLTASAVLSHAQSQEVILESPVLRGEGDFPYTADLTSAKRNGLPEAANDLARKVLSTVLTGW